jgi:hypothetical protein
MEAFVGSQKHHRRHREEKLPYLGGAHDEPDQETDGKEKDGKG